MPSLQIRDLSESLYYRILRRAREEHRSLAQQAVILLKKGLDVSVDPVERRKKLLAEIKNKSDGGTGRKLTSPVKIIREDRKR